MEKYVVHVAVHGTIDVFVAAECEGGAENAAFEIARQRLRDAGIIWLDVEEFRTVAIQLTGISEDHEKHNVKHLKPVENPKH